MQVARGPVGLPNGRDDDRDGTTDEPGEPLFTTSVPLILKGTNAVTETPGTLLALAYRLRGRWGDGTPIRAYGFGYGQTQGVVTRYAYPGDPVTATGWSENNNGTPTPNSPGDRRMSVATGPFRLAPGASETVTFAFPYARGTSNLDSVTRLRQLATGIRSLFASGEAEPQRVTAGGITTPVSQEVRLSRPFPNPTAGFATIRYAMPAGTSLRATLHDVLGRQVAVLADGPTAAPEGELTVDGARLASGVYRVRVMVPAGEQILQVVVAR